MDELTQSECVLLVDDDPTARLIAGAALESEGFRVESCSNGLEALTRLEAGGIDCVLLDVVMPYMDGFEVCAAIRATTWGAFLPILMLTSLEDAEATARAYEVGANDFAPKTTNALLLARRVQFLLRAKSTADSLRASERRLQRAQQIARLGHWEWLPGGGRAAVSESVGQILGLESGANLDFERFCSQVHPADVEMLRAAVEQAIGELGRFGLDHRIVQPGGQVRVLRHEGIVGRMDASRSQLTVLSIIYDITERRRAEERLEFLAYHDEVTGLANRVGCLEFLAEGLRRSGADSNRKVAVAVLELAGFRHVSNTLGDRRGIELVRAVAARLADVLRSPATSVGDLRVAWLGSERVALAGIGLEDPEHILPILRRVQTALTQPFPIAGAEVQFGAPAGVASAEESARDPETLLINAATAMLHARRNGPLACMFFAEPMNASAARRLALESDLRRGLGRDELWVAYQPRIELKGRRLVGVEALARWTHPWQGPIRPEEFIKIAEECGLIHEIGARVLRRACADAAAWQDRFPGVAVSVNLSGAQLRNIDFLRVLDGALADSGLDPRLLELEITESLLVDNSEAAARILAEICTRGVRVALDDFGTGYSALSYLRRFPIHVVKIDRSFVRDVLSSPEAATLVRAIVALTHSIGLHSVAEGVESLEQSQRLASYGCDEAQGFYFCKPRSVAGFLAWAESWQAAGDETREHRALTLQNR